MHIFLLHLMVKLDFDLLSIREILNMNLKFLISTLCDIDYNYFDENAYTPGEDRLATFKTELNTKTKLISQKRQKKITARFDFGFVLYCQL